MNVEEKREKRYLTSYFHCKSAKGTFCKLSWQSYPQLFERIDEPMEIPPQYSNLNLPPKYFKSRCRRCAIKTQIDNFNKRVKDNTTRGMTLGKLQIEFKALDEESRRVQRDEAPKEPDEEQDDFRDEMEIGNNPNQEVISEDNDSLIDANIELGNRIKELENENIKLKKEKDVMQNKLDTVSRVSDMDDDSLIDENERLTKENTNYKKELKLIYAKLFHTSKKLQKRQALCRQTASIRIRDFYTIKQKIETVMKPEILPYNHYLDRHQAFLEPTTWESDCNSETSLN